MSSEYVRQRLLEAIESHRKSIADLEEKLSREENPDLRRQVEWRKREIERLETELRKASLSTPSQLQRTSKHQSKSPSPLQEPSQTSVIFVWLIFTVLLLASLVFSAYFLRDLWVVLTVFLVFLLALTLLLPFIGLNIRIVREGHWFKAYLAALEKIPGLDVLTGALARQQRSGSGE